MHTRIGALGGKVLKYHLESFMHPCGHYYTTCVTGKTHHLCQEHYSATSPNNKELEHKKKQSDFYVPRQQWLQIN